MTCRRSGTSGRSTPDCLADIHLWRPYCQMKTTIAPFEVVAAEGCRLILADGRTLIDGIASWWTACHGHRHPHIVAAIKEQADRLPHVMLGGIVHPQAARLTRRLAERLPGDLNHVFLSDSGSVAVEVAMKIAIQYWLNLGQPQRTRFLSFQDAYHGDTAGAMSLCDPHDSQHAHFRGLLIEQFSLPIPRTSAEFAAFRQWFDARGDSVAAVIIEPLVQAAGGFRFHSPNQLQQIADAARRAGCLFIADEIATGFGRTGTMFACEQADVVPDIMCLGKGLSGGAISLAATVATTRIFAAFWSDDSSEALMHGTTYMGNPLACAAANASLDLFDSEPRLEQVARIESRLRDALGGLVGKAHVVDVRVRGAGAAVQVDRLLSKDRWMPFFVERGVWLRPTRDVFYLAPPLVITDDELGQLTAAIHAAVDAL